MRSTITQIYEGTNVRMSSSLRGARWASVD